MKYIQNIPSIDQFEFNGVSKNESAQKKTFSTFRTTESPTINFKKIVDSNVKKK